MPLCQMSQLKRMLSLTPEPMPCLRIALGEVCAMHVYKRRMITMTTDLG